VKRPSDRAARVRLLVLDVDGVLTDGGLYYGPAGEESKRFDAHDGLAMVEARRAGLAIAVISGRRSVAVSRRAAELGIAEVHQGVRDKAAVLDGLMARLGLALAELAVMGDDLPDLPLMRRVGLALAPRNAVAEVRRAAHWVSRRPGGGGAVREAVELLLGARRAWPPADNADGELPASRNDPARAAAPARRRRRPRRGSVPPR
jgi:3-deoxy-D-manno-octulosonate 8-phosphate phosphatase (KDO 8-P phosphatase)